MGDDIISIISSSSSKTVKGADRKNSAKTFTAHALAFTRIGGGGGVRLLDRGMSTPFVHACICAFISIHVTEAYLGTFATESVEVVTIRDNG